MKLAIFLLGLVVACSASSLVDVSLEEEWQLFKKMHGKEYPSAEVELNRRLIWQSNLDYINRHNKEASEGMHTFTVKMNKFGDLSVEEFSKMYMGFNATKNMQKPKSDRTFQRPLGAHIPDSIDWRELGAVTPVQNQLQCGSCWAFTALAALEGQHFRATGNLVLLSAQNLMDCSRAQGNYGCNGGLMDQAFLYIKINKGVDTDASYPYIAQDQDCKFNPDNIGATDTGFVDLKSGDEDDLTAAVATVGPISIAIDASQSSFQFYSSGIYSDSQCSKTNLDHSAAIVGYGSMGAGKDFYSVKNSWGTEWGMSGYFMIARNQNNMCGIASMGSYPTV